MRKKKLTEREICEKLYKHYWEAGSYHLAYNLYGCTLLAHARDGAYRALHGLKGEQFQEAVDLYYMIREIEEEFFGVKNPCKVRVGIPEWVR